METVKERLGFFDQVIYSVQPKRYKDLIEQKGRKVISYVLTLALCLSIMQFVIPAFGWFASFGGLENLFTEVLPAIELQDGKLSVGNKIEIGEDSATHILIDTERVSMQESDLNEEEYMSEILVAEENILLYSSAMGVTEIRFADLGELSVNNEGLVSITPFIYILLAVSFFAQIFAAMFDLFMWGFLMALCCWGPFRLRGTSKLAFGKVLSLALYAQTASKLVTAFNASAQLISDNYILYYAGMMVSMLLLMQGLRKLEDKEHE